MKNFKRVISAVIAMALSVSSFAAVSANKFSDVAETANYAEAIDVLSAFKIVNGYEDGTFKPEGEITRAEAATMIVGALNMADDAKAAAGSSQFADVNEKANWATGYVNVGVAQGFISGMGDGTFAPQDNVTYAQMCVMLTKITGYGDYANSYGGYPTGYTTMAASAGINKGVAAANDAKLTRGQVAQMLYNALTAPMLGVYEYKIDGNSYIKLDGSAKAGEFKSLLSDKFDGAEIKAIVDELPEAGKVRLLMRSSDYFGDNGAINLRDKTVANSQYIIDNDVDFSSLLKQEVRAIIVFDSNDKAHVVYAKISDAMDTKEYQASQYSKTTYGSDNKIKFDTTKETFANNIEVFINGYYQYTVTNEQEKVNDTLDSLLSNAVGTIKLAKLYDAKNYNAIFVDCYAIGQVTNVSYKNEVATVKFTGTNVGKLKTIEIADNDIENEDVKVKVLLGDEEIKLQDIQEDDIIAIKTDFSGIVGESTVTTIDASNKDITVLVSRDTVAGKVSSIENGDGENAFIIDGTEYQAVDKENTGLEVGKAYNIIYLDSFGRVFGYNDDAVEDTTKYAILARVYDKTEVTLILPDGTRKVYDAKDAAVTDEVYDTTDKKYVTVDAGCAVDKCIVTYKLKASTGEISELALVEDVVSFGTDAEFKAAINKVGTVGMGDTTGIINTDKATTYKDYKAMALSDFADGVVYEGFGVNKVGSNYTFVVVTKAGTKYDANSRFAVIDCDSWSQGVEDGETVDQLKVVLNGEKTKLSFSKKLIDKPSRGDIFFYTLDNDGLVEEVKVISKYKALYDMENPFGEGDISNKWGFGLKDNKDILLVSGIVVGANTSSVRMIACPTDEGAFDYDNYESFALADDCQIYTYDFDEDLDDKDRIDEEGALVASNFKDWYITEGKQGDKEYKGVIGQAYWRADLLTDDAALVKYGVNTKKFDTLEGTSTLGAAQFAIALIVDDEVVEIYQLQQDNAKEIRTNYSYAD